jgi:hypothetical protein
MYVPFEEMPDSARIWAYQSDRYLSFEEVEVASAYLLNFTNEWTAHSKDLRASFTILYNTFIILAVDEKAEGASGCSIDKSVKVMQQLEKEFFVNLFNRTWVYYKDKEGLLRGVSLESFRHMANHGQLDANTIVYNNMVQTVGELKSKWEVPANESWHKTYLPLN